jgi:hypothetical protein
MEKARTRFRALFILVVLTFGHLRLAKARDDYEIQLCGSDTIAPKTMVLELHSNSTVAGSSPIRGSRFADDGTHSSNHAEHETVEVTQGVNS